MPKVPAVPGTLKRAYSQSRLPKPREAYGNDLLGFAADRWSRINKVPEDLQALDDYAVQRRAYGGYNPEALNEMKMSILAARADAARDFDRTFGPMHEARVNRNRQEQERVDKLASFMEAYNRQFVALPPFRDKWPMDRENLRPFVRPEYREQFDNANTPIDELGDVYEYGLPEEMDRLSYPGTERYLEIGIPEEGNLPRNDYYEDDYYDARDAIRDWHQANTRPRGIPSKNFRDYETLDWDDYQYYR